MPATGALIGTPASISASVEPQTEPIDDEPFDSSVSETTRIVYGKSSAVGITGSSARCGERAVADVAALRAAHEARLPDREGREVVVVHVAAVCLERRGRRSAAPPCVVPSVSERQDLRLAAGEERRSRACAARRRPRISIGADLVRAARPSGRLLVDGDLLADEVLVDRLGGLLDELLRHASP